MSSTAPYSADPPRGHRQRRRGWAQRPAIRHVLPFPISVLIIWCRGWCRRFSPGWGWTAAPGVLNVGRPRVRSMHLVPCLPRREFRGMVTDVQRGVVPNVCTPLGSVEAREYRPVGHRDLGMGKVVKDVKAMCSAAGPRRRCMTTAAHGPRRGFGASAPTPAGAV